MYFICHVTIGILISDIILICHVTLRDHMFKELYGFTGKSPSWKATTLPCLVPIG